MNSKITVGRKLGLGFGAMMALVLGLGISSLVAVGRLEKSLTETGIASVRKIELGGELSGHAAGLASAERGMIMFAAAKDNAAVDEAERRFQEEYSGMKKASQELYSLATLAETRDLLSQLDRQVDEWRTNFSQVSTLLRAGKLDEAVKVSAAKDTPLFDQIGKDAQTAIDIRKKATSEDVAKGESLAAASYWIVAAITGFAFVVGVIVLIVVRYVTRSLRQVTSALSEGAEQVAGGAGQVSAAGQALAEGASEQAASLEETSASSEEIATMTKRNAEHSADAAQLMLSTADSVAGANRKMEEMVQSMQEITSSSSKISKIIKVIDEIAFQTNILALNAAVEAARAGEAGMGFAVVADEVRNLAQRCAQAARNTAELIEESITRSNDGGSRLSEVAQAISAITEQSSKAKVLVDEIYTGSQEQSRGIEQVAGAIAQMQKVTQANAASAEQSAAAGNEMSSQSERLRRLVLELDTMVGKSGTLSDHVTSKPKPVGRIKTGAHGAAEVFPLDEVHS